MGQTIISLWFVCRLCRGSFGQVDAFIEHKKQKHFTQFQNTTSIVFEESEYGLLCHVKSNSEDHQLAEESNERQIKIEMNDNDTVIPFSSEITDEPNLNLVEPKSELITYESEIVFPDNKNNVFALEQPEQNPYVLLKRLTSKEIQTACVPQHHSTLLFEQKNFTPRSESNYLFDTSCNNIDHNEVEKCTENQPRANVTISPEHDLGFQCKLCSKQLQSNGHLKIHVGICALYHEDRNRFCVACNRKFSYTYGLKEHRLRFHGTDEEKSNLYKFKCHLCPKQYRQSIYLSLHLESHKKEKEKKGKTSTSKPLQCPYPNCRTGFRDNFGLQSHIVAVHVGVKPFSCSVPNCNKTFSCKGSLNVHLRLHTGERPYKCTVDNCNKAFVTSHKRTLHQRRFHCNL